MPSRQHIEMHDAIYSNIELEAHVAELDPYEGYDEIILHYKCKSQPTIEYERSRRHKNLVSPHQVFIVPNRPVYVSGFAKFLSQRGIRQALV